MGSFFLENGADMTLGQAVFSGQLAEIGAVELPQDGLTAQVTLQGGALGKIQKLAAGSVDDLEKPKNFWKSACGIIARQRARFESGASQAPSSGGGSRRHLSPQGEGKAEWRMENVLE